MCTNLIKREIRWLLRPRRKFRSHLKKVLQRKEIGKEIEEVIASIVLMPYKTRSGITPQKVSYSTVISDAPIKKKKLRKMFVHVEEEEDNTGASLIRRKKIEDVGAHKVAEGSILKGVALEHV